MFGAAVLTLLRCSEMVTLPLLPLLPFSALAGYPEPRQVRLRRGYWSGGNASSATPGFDAFRAMSGTTYSRRESSQVRERHLPVFQRLVQIY